MAKPTIQDRISYISLLIEERMRFKDSRLDRQVYKAAPKLPRRVQKAAKTVLMASDLIGHPKLSRTIDHKVFHRSADIVIEHLEKIDPRDEAIGRLLIFLGKVSFVLIAAFVGVVWYLWATGKV